MIDSVPRLNRMINREARRRYPALANQIGQGSLWSTVMTRLALRANTPYPYTLVPDTKLFPPDANGFGRVIIKGRQAGIREIHSTIGRQQNERQWVFLPRESRWIDATLRSDEYYADADWYLQTFLSHLYDEVETFHTHPDSVVRQLSEKEPWSYSDNYLLEAALPSGDDLIRCAQIRARSAHSTLLTDNIISHHGVTSYRIANSGEHASQFATKDAPRTIREVEADPVDTILSSLSRLSLAYTVHDPRDSQAFHMSFTPLRG